jgi:hypothetical protein
MVPKLWPGHKYPSGTARCMGIAHIGYSVVLTVDSCNGRFQDHYRLVAGKRSLQVITLDCWKDNINALITSFHKISFSHVYREENQLVDSLSKQALNKDPGKLTYFQCVEEHEGPHMFLNLY